MLQIFKIKYLLNSVEQGEMLYKQFAETRLIEHSKSLFDTVTKETKKETVTSSDKRVHIEKENVKALKYIDTARTRNFDVQELLTYELSKQPRYLTKEKASDGKSQLPRAIEEHLKEATIKEVPINKVRSCILFDFMAYTRRVSVKTDHVQCLGDFAEHIWNTFTRLSDNSKRIDIVLDLYIDSITKGNERVRRKKSVQPIITTIYIKDQTLPVTMESLWATSTNKEQLQLFFIKYICEKYDKDITDITGCVKVCSYVVSDVSAMKCGHEDADNRILFHINHAIKDENYTKIIVASPDTDVFVSCLFHLR